MDKAVIELTKKKLAQIKRRQKRLAMMLWKLEQESMELAKLIQIAEAYPDMSREDIVRKFLRC